MKKIFLGITAAALSLTLTACGTSANNATINSLTNQLDETSNTLSNMNVVNASDISMTKETLEALATQNKSIYDEVYKTQHSLSNEEYYKADILKSTATLKNCLSNNLRLSKSQISAIRDLTNNLSKYTNSISYTKNELNSAIKSLSSMKKNASKNSDKINAKISRIACNSNTRSAYYENIINTLKQLENLVCCQDCTNEEQQIQENHKTQESISNSSTKQTETPASKTLPINIDTYAPLNRNIDSIAYNRAYANGAARNGYAPYGYYGNMYGYGNFNNGYGMPGAYGYARGMYPYQNFGYNSNNINRMNYGLMPVSGIDRESKQRLDDYEEIKNGELQKIDTAETSTNTLEKGLNSLKDSAKEKINETTEKVLNVSAKEAKKIKRIEDNRSDEEIKKDLDQPIIAH